MKVVDVMRAGVELLPAETTVQDVAVHMGEHDIGAVLVGSDGKLEGIVTDRDILLRLVTEGRSAATPIAEVMSTTLFTCIEDDTVEDAFKQMQDRQIRRMPVYNADGVLKGIVAMSDLARSDLDMDKLATARLRGIAEPHRDPTLVKDEESEPAA